MGTGVYPCIFLVTFQIFIKQWHVRKCEQASHSIFVDFIGDLIYTGRRIGGYYALKCRRNCLCIPTKLGPELCCLYSVWQWWVVPIRLWLHLRFFLCILDLYRRDQLWNLGHCTRPCGAVNADWIAAWDVRLTKWTISMLIMYNKGK